MNKKNLVNKKNLSEKALRFEFEKKQYGFFEDASVQVCEWNKKAIRGQGHCYKQDFYGADCISCHQISPVSFWCNNSCIFCWRPKEYLGSKPTRVVEPEKMIEALIIERKKLINGFKGSNEIAQKNFPFALNQKHWAISLVGEPTLYERLSELVSLLNARPQTETVFIVTNGQNPRALLKLWAKNSLPTQLYVSMVAPREDLYKSITCNNEKNGWKNYLKSLALLKLLPCRTVIRLTVIKGLNDSLEEITRFAELLEIIQPDFIEIKSYMWLGFSRERLTKENMPFHEDIKQFAGHFLSQAPSFKSEAEKKESRIFLLKNINSKFKTKIVER